MSILFKQYSETNNHILEISTGDPLKNKMDNHKSYCINMYGTFHQEEKGLWSNGRMLNMMKTLFGKLFMRPNMHTH